MTDPRGMFIWYELVTTDADAAESFYSDVIGWKAADAGMPNMDYRTLSAGDQSVGGLMQLSDEMRAGGFRAMWLGYVAVDDVDQTVAAVTADGATVTVQPSDIPNVGRFALLVDPQGAMFYVMHASNDERSYAFKADTVGHCAWNELETTDEAQALAFYSKHFGFVAGETMPMGAMGDYLMFDVDGGPIGGIMRREEQGPPPMWRFYFRVPSLARASDRVVAGGGQIIHGPQKVPGNDEIVIGLDPQGAVFSLVATATG